MASADDALDLVDITKRFGTTIALEGASLRVRAGTVHAVLGENGAGKTTLMRVAFGLVHADAGYILVRGRPIDLRSPVQAIAAGIGMVHQHFTLVPAMSVAENVALGGRGRLRPAEIGARLHDISRQMGFVLDPRALVASLGVGAQQRVEIAKALARHASILILDEPTAVLAPAEVDDLLRWLRQFAEQGNAAILITHKLPEALAVADDVTVLRRGRVVHAGPAAGSTPASLTAAMVGTDVVGDVTMSVDRRRRATTDASALEVIRAEHISIRGVDGTLRVLDASFTVRAGEILGIAAVEGSGQHELLRALAGRLPVAAGTLRRPTRVGFVPEDRHLEAVLLNRSLTENVALRDAGARHGVVSWGAVRQRTAALMTAFDVRAPGARSVLRTLSGGNQQKLVLARELETGGPPTTIVLENPTRGLDVRAMADIHARVRAARDRGDAVILYSSDLDEVLALATRVLAMHAGMVHETASDREAVGRAMLGVA